jgi:fructokinase
MINKSEVISVLYGAIEAGGTKFRCAAFDESLHIVDTCSIPTHSPLPTVDEVIRFFQKYEIRAIGVGAFGPIDLKKGSGTYGVITTTPKTEWQGFPFYSFFREHYPVPIAMATDVGAAAYGEYTARKKSHQDIENLIYVTVGTGIGAGVIYQGQILQGNHHPEMGHFILKRKDADQFPSVCPYHCDCLEGLASGISLKQRYGLMPSEMENREDIWNLEGYYLAQAIYDYTLAFSPDMIILGGGVSHQPLLLPSIQKHFEEINRRYLNYPKLSAGDYLVMPVLGDDSALYGGAVLAMEEA